MEINVKSLKFEADEKLVEFVQKKVERIEKFTTGTVQKVEVSLENLKEGKKAKIQLLFAGDPHLVERTCDTFENAITAACDAMKERLTRAKEKIQEK